MSALVGRRVLLVEDESLVAMLTEDMLIEFGCEVVLAMRLGQAMALVETEAFDLALLDVNLGSDRSYPVADALARRRTPFAFATGYGCLGLDAAYRAVPVIQKPLQAHLLEVVLTQALELDAVFRYAGLDGSREHAGAIGAARGGDEDA